MECQPITRKQLRWSPTFAEWNGTEFFFMSRLNCAAHTVGKPAFNDQGALPRVGKSAFLHHSALLLTVSLPSREKRKSWDDSMQRINLCASTFICVTAGPNGSCLFSKVCPSNCLLKQPSPFPPFIAVPFSPSAVADRGGLCTALHRHGACYITLATSFSTVLYRSFRGFRAAAHIC